MQIRAYISEVDLREDRSLAASIHFSLIDKEGNRIPLNRGTGILYANAFVDEQQVLHERFLKEPGIIPTETGYVVRAVSYGETEDDFTEDVYWSTKDFIHFEPAAPVDGVFSETVHLMDDVGVKAQAFWGAADGCAAERGHFPLAKGYGDPVLYHHDDRWYFVATNDNTEDIGLYIRCAKTIPALFSAEYEESCILDVDHSRGFESCFWAPEFHEINGDVWILFAISGKEFNPQSYMMRLRAGGDLLNPKDWEAPQPVLGRTGKPLCQGPFLYRDTCIEGGGITLDMTWIPAGGKAYVVWSYRKNIGTPYDTGSMLCIAEADIQKPYQLKSDPVVLSRPLFSWENRKGTINNEGPYAIVRDTRVYLTYAAGAANAESYVTGLLTADFCDNLCDPTVWTKRPAPLQDSTLCSGEYGPGHGAAFKDNNGKWWFSYHAKLTEGIARRDIGIRRIHFDADGEMFIGPEAM